MFSVKGTDLIDCAVRRFYFALGVTVGLLVHFTCRIIGNQPTTLPRLNRPAEEVAAISISFQLATEICRWHRSKLGLRLRTSCSRPDLKAGSA